MFRLLAAGKQRCAPLCGFRVSSSNSQTAVKCNKRPQIDELHTHVGQRCLHLADPHESGDCWRAWYELGQSVDDWRNGACRPRESGKEEKEEEGNPKGNEHQLYCFGRATI